VFQGTQNFNFAQDPIINACSRELKILILLKIQGFIYFAHFLRLRYLTARVKNYKLKRRPTINYQNITKDRIEFLASRISPTPGQWIIYGSYANTDIEHRHPVSTNTNMER
jgi:hypothetical protein